MLKNRRVQFGILMAILIAVIGGIAWALQDRGGTSHFNNLKEICEKTLSTPSATIELSQSTTPPTGQLAQYGKALVTTGTMNYQREDNYVDYSIIYDMNVGNLSSRKGYKNTVDGYYEFSDNSQWERINDTKRFLNDNKETISENVNPELLTEFSIWFDETSVQTIEMHRDNGKKIYDLTFSEKYMNGLEKASDVDGAKYKEVKRSYVVNSQNIIEEIYSYKRFEYVNQQTKANNDLTTAPVIVDDILTKENTSAMDSLEDSTEEESTTEENTTESETEAITEENSSENDNSSEQANLKAVDKIKVAANMGDEIVLTTKVASLNSNNNDNSTESDTETETESETETETEATTTSQTTQEVTKDTTTTATQTQTTTKDNSSDVTEVVVEKTIKFTID